MQTNIKIVNVGEINQNREIYIDNALVCYISNTSKFIKYHVNYKYDSLLHSLVAYILSTDIELIYDFINCNYNFNNYELIFFNNEGYEVK